MDKTLLRSLCRAAVHTIGQAELARKLGVTRQAVCKWRKIPDMHLRPVHKITGIPLHELRPDLYQPAPTDKTDVAEAFYAGRRAAANGIPLAGNPYSLSQPKAAWAAGWNSVKGLAPQS